jgi:hypothetical protein
MIFPMLLFSAICAALVLVGLHNLPKRRVTASGRKRAAVQKVQQAVIEWNHDLQQPWMEEQAKAWESLIPRKSPEHDPIAWAKAMNMTEQQKEAVKNAQTAFVAALDAGVEEDALIEAVFESKLQHDRKHRILNCIRELFAEDSRDFMVFVKEQQRF